MENRKYYLRIMAGLIFSASGDAFLCKSENILYYMMGIISFGIAHLNYFYAFYKINPERPKLKFYVGMILIFILGLEIFSSIKEKYMRFLLHTYSLSIGLTLIEAFRLWVSVNKVNMILPFIGMFLFVVSDLSLFIGEFLINFVGKNIFVMSTYYIAQLILTMSISSCTKPAVINGEVVSSEDVGMSRASRESLTDEKEHVQLKCGHNE